MTSFDIKLKYRNQSGQAVVEAVILMIIFVGFLSFAVRQFQDQALLERLVQGPWLHLAGMIESGVWAEKNTARRLHPNHIGRHVTFEGDKSL